MLAISLSLCAQSHERTENKINEIKMNASMIYGEDFNDNKDIAYDNALSDLLADANELRLEKGISILSKSDILTVVDELSYKNGSRNIVFVYMPLSKMLSLTHNSHEVIDDKFTLPQGNSGQKSENKSNSNASKPDDDKATSNLTDLESTSNEVLATLCGQDNWTEIKGFLSDFKQKGDIKETGFCTSHNEVPADAISILIDDKYGILSILSPKNRAKRINYKSNQPDTESNYPNCKVIVWYK